MQVEGDYEVAFINKTSDGRNIGIEILEVKSFPTWDDSDNMMTVSQFQVQDFLQIIKEFRTVYNDSRAVFEILWVANPVKGQAFSSEIKIFLILREIGINDKSISLNLQLLSKNICSSLKTQNYVIDICENIDDIKKRFMFVDNQCVYGLKKKEKYVISTITQTTIFYNDVLASNQYGTFDSLISRFSELKDCAISFQILPEELSIQDKVALGEMVSLYDNILNGNYLGNCGIRDIALELPMKSITSYYNSLQESLYGYNILVIGRKESAESLINRISSMLKGSGEQQVSFDIVDFSSLNIKLHSDIYNYPWNIRTYMNRLVNSNVCVNSSQRIFRRLSLLMQEQELLYFFRLPLRSKELLSLNSEELFFVSEQIDESLLCDDNIKFGIANTTNGTINLGCPKENFTKHALIVGTPGTGKTTFALNLLLQFQRKGVPFLAIEPTKTEYRALLEKIDDLQIFTPGNNEVSPFIINPFIPPRGIKVEQYIPALVSAFSAAFSMDSPLDVIFYKAIRTAYVEYGWKDYSKFGDNDVQEFGLYEFVLIFKRIIQESDYGREVKGNLETGGTFRLLNLIEQNANIYDTIKNIPIEDILTKPTILELNAIQNESQKALIMALLLSSICLYTKLIQAGDGKLKNIILVDEAHVLLGNNANGIEQGNSKGTTIDSLKNMIAEIRSYGTGIIIADQSAKMVSREIVANTDIKIAFRLVEKEEKEILGNSINADEKIKNKMSKLKTGEAFVYLSRLECPQLVDTIDIRAKENIRLNVNDNDVKRRMQYWEKHKELLKPYRECSLCDTCIEECDYFVRANARYYANKIFIKYSKELINKNEFVRFIKVIDSLLKSATEKYEECKRERFIKCCIIQLRRKVQLETKVKIADNELRVLLKNRGDNDG